MKKVTTTVYHPQGNAPIETFHRHLRKGLGALQLEGRSLQDVDEALALCTFSYRAQIHLGLADSPAYRLVGVDLQLPSMNEWRFLPGKRDRDRLRFLNLVRLDLQIRAQAAYKLSQQGERADKQQFELGDL